MFRFLQMFDYINKTYFHALRQLFIVSGLIWPCHMGSLALSQNIFRFFTGCQLSKFSRERALWSLFSTLILNVTSIISLCHSLVPVFQLLAHLSKHYVASAAWLKVIMCMNCHCQNSIVDFHRRLGLTFSS